MATVARRATCRLCRQPFPETREYDAKEAVSPAKFQAFDRLSQDRQLLPQGEVLPSQSCVGADQVMKTMRMICKRPISYPQCKKLRCDHIPGRALAQTA